MSVQTTTHLNFRGDAREALSFYQSVFGGHLVINTYADFGMPTEIAGSDKVVLGLVAAENGFRVMGYDIPDLTEGGIAGNGATRRENGTSITSRGSSCRSARRRSRSWRATGTLWRWKPRSSSRWRLRRGVRGLGC